MSHQLPSSYSDASSHLPWEEMRNETRHNPEKKSRISLALKFAGNTGNNVSGIGSLCYNICGESIMSPSELCGQEEESSGNRNAQVKNQKPVQW